MQWIEIFKVGTHADSSGNVEDWTAKRLDKIVSQFQEKKAEVPVVIGHPKTDSPAYGWVKDLKLKSGILLAKIDPTVSEFASWVNDKIYNAVSVAFRADDSLRHVGFLGGTAPAIKGLTPPQFGDKDEKYITINFVEFSENKEDLNMDELEKIKQERDDLTLKLKDAEEAKKQYEEKNKEYNEQKAVAEKELVSLRLNMRKMQFQEFLNEQVVYGALSEEQQSLAEEINEMLMGKEFEEVTPSGFARHPSTGGELKDNASGRFKEFLKSLKAPVDLKTEKMLTGEFAQKKEAAVTDKSFSALYSEYLDNHPGKNHKQISMMIFKDHPELKNQGG